VRSRHATFLVTTARVCDYGAGNNMPARASAMRDHASDRPRPWRLAREEPSTNGSAQGAIAALHPVPPPTQDRDTEGKIARSSRLPAGCVRSGDPEDGHPRGQATWPGAYEYKRPETPTLLAGWDLTTGEVLDWRSREFGGVSEARDAKHGAAARF